MAVLFRNHPPLRKVLKPQKVFQVIPSCLFNRNLESWKCTDCNQLYWEGTQYHNAVQKFLSVCNIGIQSRGTKKTSGFSGLLFVVSVTGTISKCVPLVLYRNRDKR